MMEFNKKSTLYIKGIAIILMVCNHLFPISEWIYPENQFISIPLGSKTLAAYFGGFSKICVSMFAFLTGIAMYYTYRKKSIEVGYKHTLKKLLPFFLTYWIVIICIYFPVMVISGVLTFDIQEFILNLTGYVTTYCKIAWYVRFYLELILTFPLIVISTNYLQQKTKSKGISMAVLLIINWLLRMVISRFNFPGVQYITEYFNYLPIVVVGYYSAWISIFERASVWLSNKINNRFVLLGMYFILFVSLFLARGLLTGNKWFNVDIILAPIFIMSTWYIIKTMENYIIFQKIEYVLAFLGKYALEIWFLHAIFFIGNPTVQKVAYWPRLDIFILVWTIFLLTPFAILVKKFQEKLVIFIFSKWQNKQRLIK